MSSYLDLKGTSQTSFNIGIAATAVKLKSNASVLEIKNKADSAFLDIRALVLKATGDSIILNDDATLAGADWKLTFARPAAGMTASVTYTFPAVPTNGYFLTTDASGNFTLKVKQAASQLTITAVGYDRQQVDASGNTVSVQLARNTQELTTVVVTALGVQRQAIARRQQTGDLHVVHVAIDAQGQPCGLVVERLDHLALVAQQRR